MTTAPVAPAGTRRLPLLVAGALLLTAIAYPLTHDGAVRDAVSWTIVLLGAALSVSSAAVGRGLRTAGGLLLLVALVSVGFEALGLGTGFPYGGYHYSHQLGPTLLGVPFLVPLAWLMMTWPSWVLATRLASGRPVRILVAAYLFAAWDVLLDPQMVDAGYWRWSHPQPGLPGIPTVPLTNLAGWLLAGLVLMAAVDVLVARTARPVPGGSGPPQGPRPGDAAALIALAWMTLGGALAHVGWLGLPGSAAWEVVLALPVLAALARRTRRPVPGGPR